MIETARRRVQAGDENYRPLVERVIEDPAWNGVLFVNAEVPLEGLPRELRGLAAGIDPRRFFAHHLGFDETPIGAMDPPQMRDSPAFGLIAYEDAAGATDDSGADFGFRVTRLTVRFRNSRIAAFASEIALTLNRLFSARTRRRQDGADAADNRILMGGVYQRHGDGYAYVFGTRDASVFRLEDAILTSVRLDKAQFVTLADTDREKDGAQTVESRFSFWGGLSFSPLTQDSGSEEHFDLFSYRSLAFADLGLGMSFSGNAPSAPRFRFDPGKIRFDPGQSEVREQGLARLFPLSIRGLAWSDARKRPADLGYLPVTIPLETGELGSHWYALEFDLDLGNAGALAAEAGLVAGLMLAWSPDATRQRVQVGLRMPGSGCKAFSLQGIVKLDLNRSELLYNRDEHGGEGGFLLLLDGMRLSFLGKTLPPGGTFDFYLFGDPRGIPGSLGWYGAYKQTSPSEPEAGESPDRRPPLPSPAAGNASMGADPDHPVDSRG
jgi:hypothetical protein